MGDRRARPFEPVEVALQSGQPLAVPIHEAAVSLFETVVTVLELGDRRFEPLDLGFEGLNACRAFVVEAHRAFTFECEAA